MNVVSTYVLCYYSLRANCRQSVNYSKLTIIGGVRDYVKNRLIMATTGDIIAVIVILVVITKVNKTKLNETKAGIEQYAIT